jgi:hypothetical protein
MPSSSCSSSSGISSRTEGQAGSRIEQWAPLHESVLQLDLAATQQLLQEGADPNVAFAGGITPAMLLCLVHVRQGECLPDLLQELHQHLTAWRTSSEFQSHLAKPLLQLLLSHGARVDLLYPRGYDMLEAASVAGATGLLEVLLGVEPFRSMMEGTWGNSSSSSSEPCKQQSAGSGTHDITPDSGCTTSCNRSSSSSSNTTTSTSTTANTTGSDGLAHDMALTDSGNISNPKDDAPSPICSRLVNRCSQPLYQSAKVPGGPELHILQLGWRPDLHPADAGEALLVSCKQVSPAACIRVHTLVVVCSKTPRC